MNQQKHPAKLCRMLFYTLATMLAVFLVFWGARAPKNITLNPETDFPNISEDWRISQDGEWSLLEDLSSYQYQQGRITIERTLPLIVGTKSLLFYTEHQQVQVWIDGDRIYSYEIPAHFSKLKTPGNTWHAIALLPEHTGKTIQIHFVCPFPFYQILPDDLFLLSPGELQIAQAYSIWFCNTVALFMLVLSIISFVRGSFWKSGSIKRYTLRLGTVYCLISIWLLTEINIATLVLRNSITTYLFAMLLIRLLPLSMYHFLQVLSPAQKRWELGEQLFAWLFTANVFLPFVLQFTLEISLLETLWFTYLLALLAIGASLCRMLAYAIWCLRSHLAPSLYDILYFFSALLLFGALGEIYFYVNYARLGTWRGTAISIAAICYTVLTRLILVRIETQFERETEALAQENNKLQLLPLMQQINAHFLFNTLNNISFLCKRDPKAADNAVILLSEYMRDFMFLVNTSELIPFSRECALMDAYLNIQKIRFRERISFSITLEESDFYLPPLCIQPFVENAIFHGIRKKKDGGEISICQTQEGSYTKITVRDNGAGFDTAELQRSTRIGIQNVQKRLALYGGWVEINSAPSGTTVDIFIPSNLQPLRQEEKTK